MRYKPLIMLLLFVMISTNAYALQLIVGHVQDAADGQSANGYTVRIWKPTNRSDYREGVIVDNVYAINCGSPGGLHDPCVHGDIMYAQVVHQSGYASRIGWTRINVSDGSPSTDTINLTLVKIMPIAIRAHYVRP